MRTHTDIRRALDHLPEAALLVVEGVAWAEYEEFLRDLGDRSGLRVTYDRGRLEIVTTSAGHEARKELILRLVHVLSEEMGIELESRGGMTQKREQEGKGTEPDTCFYVTDVERIIAKDEIDLKVDPPPDIVVEIDKANQSHSKFPIYAAFRVPEIWRYDEGGQRAEMFALQADVYVRIEASCFFPILTSEVLTRFVEQSQTQGQSVTLSTFREWVRTGRG